MRKSAPVRSLLSVERAIDILYYLADHPFLSVQDLSERLRWPKSTTYRFLHVLRRKQLVDRDPATARYRVGLGILRVQRAVLEHLPVRMAALAVMRDLAPRLGETVVLTVRRGDFGVAVESIESLEPVRVAPAPGDHVPLHCGAPMKVILAFSPEDDIGRYLRRRLERYTPNTICQPRRLRLHLAEIRAKGYAESWEEVFVGATGIAVPILGVDGHANASLAVAGPTQRMTHERVRAIAQDLIAAGKEVTLKLQLAAVRSKLGTST
jgi:DNA-binding IclR family transcriptional regulator